MTDQPKWFESRKRSVDNLQRIYSFVVSLSVVEALRRTLTGFPSPTQTVAPVESWMHLVVILATLVPFYHGANRYLDAAYVTGERTSVKFALIIDFLFLFGESILFFSLGLLVGNPKSFYVGFVSLLGLDVIWVGTTVFTTRSVIRSSEAKPGIGRWAVLNIVTILIVLCLYWSTFEGVTVWRVVLAPSALLAFIAVIRSVLDYYILWHFYYPEEMVDAGEKSP